MSRPEADYAEWSALWRDFDSVVEGLIVHVQRRSSPGKATTAQLLEHVQLQIRDRSDQQLQTAHARAQAHPPPQLFLIKGDGA